MFLVFLLIRCVNFLGWNSPEQMNNLSEEFVEFQLLNDNDIPKETWDKATVSVDEDEKCYHRMDFLWQYISTVKSPDHTPRFLMLSKVAMLVLVIPHSNAEEERVFSMVRKNKTAFRPSLDSKGTLSSILTIKLGQDKPSHQFEPTKEVLKKAKSATRIVIIAVNVVLIIILV